MRRVLMITAAGLYACALFNAVSCASSAEVDSDETIDGLPTLAPPLVAFDPAGGVIPTPNTLGLVSPTTGRLDLPATCGETPTGQLTREGILNTLNGWPSAAPQPIEIPLTSPVDEASIEGSVLVFNTATVAPVEFIAAAGTVDVFDGDCNDVGDAPILNLVITERLQEGTTYSVILLDGLRDAAGEAYSASSTWNFVRQEEAPVDIVTEAEAAALGIDFGGDAVGIDTTSGAQVPFDVRVNNTPFDPTVIEEASSILGIDTLWNFYNLPLVEGVPGILPGLVTGLGALGTTLEREDILQAFVFTTQTGGAFLDPTTGVGPAAAVMGAAPSLIAPLDLLDGDPTMSAAGDAFPAASLNIDLALCGAAGPGCGICDQEGPELTPGQLPCFAAGKSLTVQFESTDYGPGTWNDPYMPSEGAANTLTALYFEPAGAMPENGWPVVVFGHGLGATKESVFAAAPGLLASGIAVIAIDWPLHGTPGAPPAVPNGTNGRGVLDPTIDVTELPACAAAQFPDFTEQDDRAAFGGDEDGVAEAACYIPFLSADLTATRDTIRQGLLDVQEITAMLGFCSDNACDNEAFGGAASIDVDGGRIGYIGQSLGGILGASVASLNPDIQAAVLNVAAVDWVEIFENSQTFGVVCPLINALSDTGVFVNTPREDIACEPGNIDPTTWNTDPGYIQFAFIANWVLESADGVSFAPRLTSDTAPPVLLQEVDGDLVIDNSATAILGGILGVDAVMANTGAPAPTMGVTDGGGPGESVLYIDYESGSSNAYAHSSLLQPAPLDDGNPDTPDGPSPAGSAGTAQMQTDAFTFLQVNLAQ